jgi:hypothetical protein
MRMQLSLGVMASAAYITGLIGLVYECVTAPTRDEED